MALVRLPINWRNETLLISPNREYSNKMFTNLITCTQKIKHYNEHCLEAKQNITEHKTWQTVIQMYTILNCPPPPAEEIKNNVITPLIQYMENHYTKLHNQQYHLIIQHIHNTYLTLNNDHIFNNIKHLSIEAIQEAFTNFNNYLQNKCTLITVYFNLHTCHYILDYFTLTIYSTTLICTLTTVHFTTYYYHTRSLYRSL